MSLTNGLSNAISIYAVRSPTNISAVTFTGLTLWTIMAVGEWFWEWAIPGFQLLQPAGLPIGTAAGSGLIITAGAGSVTSPGVGLRITGDAGTSTGFMVGDGFPDHPDCDMSGVQHW